MTRGKCGEEVALSRRKSVTKFQKIRNVLTCRATTSDSMAKWRFQLDSACPKGAEIPFQGLLIVCVDGL